MFEGIVKTLRGLILNPLLVAFARGAAEAGIMAAIIVGIDAFSAGDLRETYPVLAPIIVLGLRQLEGVVDKIDPAKQRRRDVLRESPVTDEDGNPLSASDFGDIT